MAKVHDKVLDVGSTEYMIYTMKTHTKKKRASDFTFQLIGFQFNLSITSNSSSVENIPTSIHHPPFISPPKCTHVTHNKGIITLFTL